MNTNQINHKRTKFPKQNHQTNHKYPKPNQTNHNHTSQPERQIQITKLYNHTYQQNRINSQSRQPMLIQTTHQNQITKPQTDNLRNNNKSTTPNKSKNLANIQNKHHNSISTHNPKHRTSQPLPNIYKVKHPNKQSSIN